MQVGLGLVADVEGGYRLGSRYEVSLGLGRVWF